MIFRRKRKFKNLEIDPEHIFQDNLNIPGFDDYHLEGRVELPIEKASINRLLVFFFVIFAVLAYKNWALAVSDSAKYKKISDSSTLQTEVLTPKRGVVYDRNNKLLAWNQGEPEDKYLQRMYIDKGGFGNLLGYVAYPKKDNNGNYWQNYIYGVDGVEKVWNKELQGVTGYKTIERDVSGTEMGTYESVTPVDGENITLSVDSDIQSQLYQSIKSRVVDSGFAGGAGVIIDIHNGDLITSTSYPEYSSQVMSDRRDSNTISEYLSDTRHPFLHKPTEGLFTPGSVLKPIVAYGALNEKIISPNKNIYSAGYIRIPNPYKAGAYSQFNDWKAHGYTDMAHAIAVSSDVYFYAIGGGFEDQRGLGIDKIDEYMRKFGIGEKTNLYFGSDPNGVVPTPSWKEKVFKGDQWRVGDTYNSSIGQFGFTVTPLQVVKAIATIASDGKVVTPTLIKGFGKTEQLLDYNLEANAVIKKGMRLTVNDESGTALGLNVPYVSISAKTGTAQVGKNNSNINSWITGYWPSENPRYAFVVLLERGPLTNSRGAWTVMKDVFDYMNLYKNEYLD